MQNQRKWAMTTRIGCLLAAGFVVCGLFGCALNKGEEKNSASAPQGEEKKSVHVPKGRMLVILLDETESFSNEWNDSVQKAAGAIRSLNPGDAFLAAAITDHGWRSQDIRIPLTKLTTTSLLSIREKARLMDTIKALKVRETSSGYLVNGKPKGVPHGTDLLGAIDYAAFLARQAENQSVSIVLFTDLEDEAPKNVRTAGRTLQTFPRFTHLAFLNVRAGGGDVTQERINRWCQLLNQMKHPDSDAVVSSTDFHTIGEAAQVTDVFRWTKR